MQLATRPGDAAVRAHLEVYYDAVPRGSARAEDLGPLTLFVRTGTGTPYYGRPTRQPGRRDGREPVTADTVRVLLARQHELGLPASLEWVDETTPELAAAATGAGLVIHEHPLMVFEPGSISPPIAADIRARIRARILAADDPALATAIAAAHLAFSEPGTAPGIAGRAELSAKAAELSVDGWLLSLADRMRAGTTVVAAAFAADETAADDDGTAVCSGQHNPIETTSEIVGIGTLPTMRRRGLAHAVTALLVADAQQRGIDTIFLSAGDADVARIYARIGFRQIGTAMIADSVI